MNVKNVITNNIFLSLFNFLLITCIVCPLLQYLTSKSIEEILLMAILVYTICIFNEIKDINT